MMSNGMNPTAYPLFNQARTTDPDTSHKNVSIERQLHAADWVQDVMSDGVERTDEEIFAECVRRGCTLTDGRIRHGRLSLSFTKYLVLVGTKQTASGAMGRTWRKA
jgi:hypothetical protein